MKRLFDVTPARVVYELTTGQEMDKILTTIILTETGLTSDEIGLYGNSMFWDAENKSLCILSKFNANRVMTNNKGFGKAITFIPELDKLEGKLFSGNIEDYVFDMNEKEEEVTFNWHPDISLAFIANVSLVDPKFKLTYEILEKQKTDRKKQSVAVRMLVTASLNKNGEVAPYDPDEIPTWIDIMQG